MFCQYASSSACWFVQWPAESTSAAAQACGLVAASPNQTVACELASGDIMWFIHMSMQLGCAASFASIQVSDQPVVPSLGFTAATDTPSAWSSWFWRGHVVPTTTSPAVYEAIWSVYDDQ